MLVPQPECIDMGVVSDNIDLAERYHRLAKMGPIGNDLVAGIKLLAGLGIKCIKD